MIINQKHIKDGITTPVLRQLIRKHQREKERYVRLHQYYLGKHRILERVKENRGAANNRVFANHAKYITDMAVAYFMGAPVSYAASEGYDMEGVKDAFLSGNMAIEDYRLAKESSICGTALEMLYADENAMPRACVLPTDAAFVVYDDSVEKKKLLGVYYYREVGLDDTPGDYAVICADENAVRYYHGRSLLGLRQEREVPHYFGAVPFVEYQNNEEAQGDFEQEISLMDAYNTLLSDRVNDKEQFVDAFLLLLGIEITGEQAEKLKQEKVLCGEIGGSAEYLSKALNESDAEVLRKAIKEDIHKMAMVPDLTDEQFAGNLSGIAMKYKLLGFEQNIRNKERMFEKGLRERLAMYMNFLQVKRNSIPIPQEKIDVEFHHNLPANELEIAQMVSMLSGIVSEETLLTKLPFVTDAKEEANLAEKERLRKQEAIRDVMDGYRV